MWLFTHGNYKKNAKKKGYRSDSLLNLVF